jgi:hypothetical protein
LQALTCGCTTQLPAVTLAAIRLMLDGFNDDDWYFIIKTTGFAMGMQDLGE